MDDRTSMVPKHVGSDVLPCSPFFTRLLRHATYRPNNIAIRDVHTNVSKTYVELLSDVLSFRAHLRTQLPQHVLAALDNREEIYICIFAPGGYEYAVAVLAVLAIGAAAVPLAAVLPVEEAVYFVRKARSAVVLVAESTKRVGSDLEAVMRKESVDFKCVRVQQSIGVQPVTVEDILISTDKYLDDNAPGFVIFTSGTTGPPKGAVMRRAYVHDCANSVAEHFNVQPDDVLLHVLPVHHATGVGIMFFPFLMAGACLEFRSGGFDEVRMWERWREGVLNKEKRLTFFSGVPTIYMRMMRYFESTLQKLPESQRREYIDGARQFRALLCGTSALPRPVDEFWAQLLGHKIVQRYGGTEFGAVFKVRMGATNVPDGSVGECFIGVDLKLSDGDEGEVLIKSPYMFSKYLFDPEATRKAHDEDGYYKSGDIARREGKFYFILGRESQDIIKSGGYKISALDIEREILALRYISEVMVVGVPDPEFGQRVAALISLRDEHKTGNGNSLSIDRLRNELRKRLAGYKLPTLLRIIEGDIPKSGTGKVSKKALGPQFFPPQFTTIKEVQTWTPTSQVRAKSKL